jgi:uncharacterized protein YyaL (SSP411 family)
VYGAIEVAIVGAPSSKGFRALASAVASRYVPSLVLAGGPPGDGKDVGLLREREQRQGEATAYLCRGYVCSEPTTSVDTLVAQLESAAGGDSAR